MTKISWIVEVMASQKKVMARMKKLKRRRRNVTKKVAKKKVRTKHSANLYKIRTYQIINVQ